MHKNNGLFFRLFFPTIYEHVGMAGLDASFYVMLYGIWKRNWLKIKILRCPLAVDY